jgi:hypothetical protein
MLWDKVNFISFNGGFRGSGLLPLNKAMSLRSKLIDPIGGLYDSDDSTSTKNTEKCHYQCHFATEFSSLEVGGRRRNRV